jgi:poly(3-hydroxybutyrate) depolymerase
VQQWSAALGIDDVPDETVVAGRYEGHRYTDSTGTARLEVFEIPGLAHAIALDARPSSPKCGKVGPYSTDVEICAAEWIGRWFGVVHQVTDGATSSAGSSTQ